MSFNVIKGEMSKRYRLRTIYMSQNQEMMATELGLFNGKTKNFPSFQDLLSETCNVEEIIPEIRV